MKVNMVSRQQKLKRNLEKPLKNSVIGGAN